MNGRAGPKRKFPISLNMLALLYLSVVFFTVFQSVSTKLFNKKQDDALFFNALKSIFAFLPFFIFSLFGFRLHGATIAYGFLYGVLLSASMVCGYNALRFGPMALTSMLVSFSVVIPLIYGICVGEKMTALKIVGLILLACALAAVNARKKTDGETKKTFKWSLFVFLTFLCNGLCSVVQKIHQTAYPSLFVSEFMTVAMLVCALVFSTAAVAKRTRQKKKSRGGTAYGIAAGISMAIVHYCTTALVDTENASVLFPAISAGTLVFTLFCGFLVFKEKPKANQYLALLLGLCSIVCLKS